MRINLCLTSYFETDFQERHYYVYQFVDPQTLTILSYSSTNDEHLVVGKTYDCVLTIKKSKLAVSNVSPLK